MIQNVACCLVFLLTLTGCAQQGDDTIRLIPEGYMGTVLIIFNQEDGTPKEYDNGKRIYRIPENGILKTQFEPNYGSQKNQFFYENDIGERKEITFVNVENDEYLKIARSDDTFAYLEYTLGKVEKYDPNTRELLYTIQPARTFYIGNLSDVDQDYQEQLDFTFKNHKK